MHELAEARPVPLPGGPGGKLLVNHSREERPQQYRDLHDIAQHECQRRPSQPQGWGTELAKDQDIAEQDVDHIIYHHSDHWDQRAMDAIKKSVQSTDRYSDADRPKTHTKVDNLQDNNFWLVTEKRKEPRSRRPQDEANNTHRYA